MELCCIQGPLNHIIDACRMKAPTLTELAAQSVCAQPIHLGFTMHTLVWSGERQAQAKSHCNADCLIIQTETKGGHWERTEPCAGLPTLDSQETSSCLAVGG